MLARLMRVKAGARHYARPPPINADLELEFLGTSSSMPTMRRNTSCLAFKHPKFTWIFDCGEGSQRQRLFSHLSLSKIDKIFVTHLHADHVLGLPGLMMSMDHMRRAKGVETPITLYGPVGLHDFLGQIFFRTKSMPKFEVYELSTMEVAIDNPRMKKHERLLGPNDRVTVEGVSCYRIVNAEQTGLEVLAVPIAHTVDCFGYVIREPDRPARLDITRAMSKGVMLGPAISVLKNGLPVITRDGVEVLPEQVMDPARRGRKIVILGDTNNPSSLSGIARSADILVHECTFAAKQETIARERGHSTSGMAGAFARSVEARTLILNHFSPRFGRQGAKPTTPSGNIQMSEGYDEPQEEEPDRFREGGDDEIPQLLLEARRTFKSDTIFAAEDFDRFVLPFPAVAGRPRQACYRLRRDDVDDY